MLLSRYRFLRNGGVPRRIIGWLLGGIAGLFVVAAAYTSFLIVERQEALRQVSRYNVTWLASQAVAELERLQQRIATYAVPGSGIDQDEVQLRLDILVNRVQLLRAREVEELIKEDPELRSIVADLTQAVEVAQPLVDSLETADSVRTLMGLFAPLGSKLARLAAAANVRSGDRVAADQRHLSQLHWTFSGILLALAFGAVALFFLLLWHNRLLRRTHHALLSRTTELRVQNERFDAALSNMSQALCMVDADQRLTVYNRRYLELFGLPSSAIVAGVAIRDVQHIIACNGRWPEELVKSIHEQQQMLVRDGLRATFSRAADDGRALAVSHEPMSNGGWIATYEDITARQRAEAKIAYMAQYDTLTGLANRALFRDRTERALASFRHKKSAVALLCLDLDHFKEVNDSLGHPTGDALLRAVAQRLRECVREGDTVARLGGDEFAILQIADQPNAAEALAERLVEVVGRPYDVDGQRLIIGVSVGIAEVLDDTDPDQLLKNADLALYHAKATGRATFRSFAPEMETHLLARRALQADLREASDGCQFEVFYQPLVDLGTGEITGFEALLRWFHSERGAVSPAEFIPLAEETGLILMIGEWVLHQACTDAMGWPHHTKVAVNISPVQFRSADLVQVVVNALTSTGLPPSRLELEITESVLLEDNEAVLAVLHPLRELGVRIALDDFGTGYSSLSYLRNFPFDKIKIDQTFVREMMVRPDCTAIINSIISLASKLGMTTLAEGVETDEQLSWLRRAGCTEAQGYLLGRPGPAAKALADLDGASVPTLSPPIRDQITQHA